MFGVTPLGPLGPPETLLRFSKFLPEVRMGQKFDLGAHQGSLKFGIQNPPCHGALVLVATPEPHRHRKGKQRSCTTQEGKAEELY